MFKKQTKFLLLKKKKITSDMYYIHTYTFERLMSVYEYVIYEYIMYRYTYRLL